MRHAFLQIKRSMHNMCMTQEAGPAAGSTGVLLTEMQIRHEQHRSCISPAYSIILRACNLPSNLSISR